jgi:hypothetical protein
MKNEMKDYIITNTKQGNVYLGIVGGGWGRWAIATGLSDSNPWGRIKAQNITAIAIFTNLEKANKLQVLHGIYNEQIEGQWMKDLEKVFMDVLEGELGKCPWFKSNTELYGDFDSHIEALQWVRNFLSIHSELESNGILYDILYLDHLT